MAVREGPCAAISMWLLRYSPINQKGHPIVEYSTYGTASIFITLQKVHHFAPEL